MQDENTTGICTTVNAEVNGRVLCNEIKRDRAFIYSRPRFIYSPTSNGIMMHGITSFKLFGIARWAEAARKRFLSLIGRPS